MLIKTLILDNVRKEVNFTIFRGGSLGAHESTCIPGCKAMITAHFSTHMLNLIRRISKLKSEWIVIYVEYPTCCGDAKKFFGICTDLLVFVCLRKTKSLFKLWCTDCRLLDDLICNNIQVKLKKSGDTYLWMTSLSRSIVQNNSIR